MAAGELRGAAAVVDDSRAMQVGGEAVLLHL